MTATIARRGFEAEPQAPGPSSRLKGKDRRLGVCYSALKREGR
jgi:hypothetical protein